MQADDDAPDPQDIGDLLAQLNDHGYLDGRAGRRSGLARLLDRFGRGSSTEPPRPDAAG